MYPIFVTSRWCCVLQAISGVLLPESHSLNIKVLAHLVPGDFLDGVAEQLGVVDAERGDAADPRPPDDVGGVVLAADAHLRHSDVSHVIVKPGRLTDEAPTLKFASSVDEAGDNQISRANVAYALLRVVQTPDLINQEVTLLDGKRPIDALL